MNILKWNEDSDVFLTLKINLESQNYALFDDPFEIQWKSNEKKSRTHFCGKNWSLFSKIHQWGHTKISVHFPEFIDLSRMRLQKDFVPLVLGNHRCFEGRAFEMSNNDSLDETHRTADNPV